MILAFNLLTSSKCSLKERDILAKEILVLFTDDQFFLNKVVNLSNLSK